MSIEMQRALLRRACARVTETLALCRDLPAGDLFLARLALIPVLGLASRGPMLALPWREKPLIDGKMRAAGDDTYTPTNDA
jgi:hypothetical protein